MRLGSPTSDQDVEDRRDEGGGGYGGGGGMGMGLGGRHIGIGGLLLLGVLSLVFKRDLLSPIIGGVDETPGVSAAAPDPARTQAEQPTRDVAVAAFNDAQENWQRMLGGQYRHAKLVLYRDATGSACGTAETATGPFYCPGDEKVYLDLGFYDELKERFGAPGQFAQAYVLAHELGHHVQKLLGIEAKVRQLQGQNPANENPLSVRMELQADCFAGVWGKTAQERNLLDPGDVESGLGAAAAVGDDRIARMAGARVSPERFTHGSSAQRVSWFKQGMQNGRVQDCDTFNSQQ